VIWTGDVAPYLDVIAACWASEDNRTPEIIKAYGTIAEEPGFWASILPNATSPTLAGRLGFGPKPLIEARQPVDQESCELYTYAGE
jgi:hypothetical protein